MNILDVQDNLKNFSEKQLINEMQMPSGNAPQFLVLSEITRRKRMRDQMNMQLLKRLWPLLEFLHRVSWECLKLWLLKLQWHRAA